MVEKEKELPAQALGESVNAFKEKPILSDSI